MRKTATWTPCSISGAKTTQKILISLQLFTWTRCSISGAKTLPKTLEHHQLYQKRPKQRPKKQALGNRPRVTKNSRAPQNFTQNIPDRDQQKQAKNMQKGSKMSVWEAPWQTCLGGPPGDRAFGKYFGSILALRAPVEEPKGRKVPPKHPKEWIWKNTFKKVRIT